MRRYALHLLSTIILLIAGAVAVNWLADPYAVFGTPFIRGINAAKPEIVVNQRIFKMVGFVHQKMDALILGTSRSDTGLSPQHEGFKNMRTLNLSMGAQPNAETATIFKFVANHASLEVAVIGLDFFASNALFPHTADFTPDNFDADRKWKLLFSGDTLWASKKTLFQSNAYPQWPDSPRMNTHNKFYKQAFVTNEKGFMWAGNYLPPPRCEYLFEVDKFEKGRMRRYAPLEDIRSLIEVAYRRHVKLYLFISPSHARQWETLASVGLWGKWEEWKRRLVEINEAEARKAGKAPFPLWDFSGYHTISTEMLPVLGDVNAEMYGYLDSSHYKPVVGNLLLDRMFGLHVAGREIPDDFGVPMGTSNIDSHLAHIRAARQRYKTSHPFDVMEIERFAEETKNERKSSCRGRI